MNLRSDLSIIGVWVIVIVMINHLASSRIRLGPLSHDEAKVLFAYRSDPRVYAYHAWNPESEEDARNFIERHSIQSKGNVGEWRQLGIYDRSPNTLIGDCGYFRRTVDEVEIGYTIIPARQGQGLATEVVSVLIKQLFQDLPLERIVARTDPENTASIRVLDKCGFTLVSHHRKSVKIRGEWKDDLVFCLRKEDVPGQGNSEDVTSN